jgi:hypothetical protein
MVCQCLRGIKHYGKTNAMIITKLVRLAIIDVHERTSLAETTERLDAAFITLNRVKVFRISATPH